MRIRLPGASPGGVAMPSRIIGKLLAAAPGCRAGLLQIVRNPKPRVFVERDADDRFPRRYDLKRHRLSSAQHRVADRL
jgi:hypothetical protein